MKTCGYCGRTYPDDIMLCPACGLNLDGSREGIRQQIEIEMEPENRNPSGQRPAPAPAAPVSADPGLIGLYGRNRVYYLCRYLLGLAICLLGFFTRHDGLLWIVLWDHLTHPGLPWLFPLEAGDYLLIGLFLAAIAGGIYECVRLAKPPWALLRAAPESQEAYMHLFSFTDRWRIRSHGGQFSFSKLASVILGFFSFNMMLELPVVLLVSELRSPPNLLVIFALISAYGAMWWIRIIRVRSIYQKHMPHQLR